MIAIKPNDDVIVCCFMIGNIYQDSIVEIIKRYDPYRNSIMATLYNKGVSGLIKFVQDRGVASDISYIARHALSVGIW